MSRTLKVIGNHVMYDCGAWFLRVIMSSLDALCCSKVIGNWHFACFVLLEDIGNHVMYDRGAWFPRVIMSSLHALCCCCQWIEEAKTWLTIVTFFFCSMYNKAIIIIMRFSFCDIQNIQSLGKCYQPPLPRPSLFWISQKPHPIIIIYYCIRFCMIWRNNQA